MRTVADYEALLPYCKKDRQKEVVNACIAAGSNNKASKILGCNRKNVDGIIERIENLAIRTAGPDWMKRDAQNSGGSWGGDTTLYKGTEDDDFALQWIRRKPDQQKIIEYLENKVMDMSSLINPAPKIAYEGNKATDKQFSVFPIGDPHIGLLCWAKEVNQDWDVEIAKRVFKTIFERLVSMMPLTQEAILINTGDLFHADNIDGQTSRSGHHLDLDGRHGKWIDAAMMIVRMWIETLLRRYKRVHYVNVIGNHDDILGRFMGSLVENVYESNKRLTLQKGDNAFQYLHREKVLLGFAHGHTTKMANLPGKMADDVPHLWGQSTLRHWITGHVHHNQFIQFKEHPGCSVESVGIIPPKDSYSHGGAYGARRGTQGIIFDKEHGEISMRRETNVRGSD